jgi:hypothetical protein
VKQLPFAEKLQIMEAIWEDSRVQAERVPVPQWHRDLLDERRKGVAEGREPRCRRIVGIPCSPNKRSTHPIGPM